MEDFETPKPRKVPRTELKQQKNYMELLPRPTTEEYTLLKESVARDGLCKALPILVNEDDVVLDGYTRLQIADELKIEWVWVQTLEFENHFEEKIFIIKTNLLRRHLSDYEQKKAALTCIEIAKEMAKQRQRQAGDKNLKQYNKNQGGTEVDSNLPVPQKNWGTDKHIGEALEKLARDFQTNRETLRQVQKIEEAAQTDPEIADAREKIRKNEASINQVYQQVQAKTRMKPAKKKAAKTYHRIEQEWKSNTSIHSAYAKLLQPTYFERMTEHLPDPEPMQDEEIMAELYGLANHYGWPPEAIDGAIKINSTTLAVWRWWSQGLYRSDLALDYLKDMVVEFFWRQRAARPEEVPVPDGTKKLGPWALDFVHQAGLQNLVWNFPSESVHLIYSDATVELEQLGLLGEFAARVLTQGKYLCVYVDKRNLPEAMARLSMTGLTYFWTCMVFRPRVQKNEELKVKDIWRLLLIYQKSETASEGWEWFFDSIESVKPASRDLVRELVKGLTTQGQMVVDPLVGSGITGQVARSLERRFICFGAEEGDVRAANQRIAEIRLAQDGG